MNSLGIFWRGLLMGGADIIPGVSGGTMAFITGIYERFIDALRGLTKSPKDIVAQRSIRPLLQQDWGFLLPLGIGIAISFGIGSLILPPMIEAFPALVYAFFIGLILASAVIIFGHIKKHDTKSLTSLIAGLLLGVIVGVLTPAMNNDPSMLYVLLAGFIGITAMLLPGISGSYILLIMGVYAYMLDSIRNMELGVIAVFGIGALLGIAALSNVLSWLLEHKRPYTLAALVGIMVGALTNPLKVVIINAQGTNTWIAAAILAVIGAGAVLMLERLTHRVGRPVPQ